MTKPNKWKDKARMYNISRKMAPFQHDQYYFVAAAVATAVATAIAGIVHLYMPLSHPMLIRLSPMAIFFLGSGIAQIFWILPIIKRWGRPWYYVGIGGNLAFIMLYIICLLYTSPSPRDTERSRMPSSA